MPEHPEEWPTGVLESLKAFRQGDLVSDPPFAYHTDPRAPIWRESIRFADELRLADEPLLPDVIHFPVTVSPPYGLIITQTCDIVEEGANTPAWPWVQLVPVYDMSEVLNSGERKMLVDGRGWRRHLHVPNITSGFHVADFRISFPVEKGWLASQAPIDGFGTEELRERVGDRLASLAGRPAFAGSFVATVQKPLTDALRELKRQDPELFAEIDRLVPEVGVRLDSRLSPTTAQVVVICTEELPERHHQWWIDWLDRCRPDAFIAGITLQALDFKVLDESFSAAEYRSLTRLPLVTVSTE